MHRFTLILFFFFPLLRDEVSTYALSQSLTQVGG